MKKTIKKTTKKLIVAKKRKTLTERRIEVLKDALLQIKAKKYRITKGLYIELSLTLEKIRKSVSGEYFENSQPDVSAQECLLRDTKPCKVCAKGAIFLSLIRKENKVMMSEIYNSYTREEFSNKLFGEKNLNKMEAAFEKWYYKNGIEYSNYEKTFNKKDVAVYNFANKYPKEEDRLIAIIKNAIKNDGIFKPQLA